MSALNRYALQIGLLMIFVYIGLSLYSDKTPYSNMLTVNILQLLASLYASILLFNAYRTTKLNSWLYYCAGAVCYLTAQLYWTLFLILFKAEPAAFGFFEIFWMIQYIFYIMALYHQNKTNNKKLVLRFTLDVLLFTIVTATMYWRFLFEPLVAGKMLSSEEILFNLFCSSATAVILFGLLILYIYERNSTASKATFLLMAGFFIKTCGNTIALYLNQGAFWSETVGWLPEICWFAGLVFLGFSALASNAGLKAVRSINLSGRYNLRRYVPLVVVCLLIIAYFCAVNPLSVTLAGLIIAFVLLLLRLLLAIRDYESADEALQESIHNYRDLVENSLIGVIIEQDGILVYVNRYCVELFGYSPGEMIGQPLLEYFSLAEYRRLQEEFAQLDVHKFTPRLCFECRRKDQSILYVDLQAATTLYQGRKAVSVTLLDITERQASEQLLIRSEKLSVVGQLAAGVAHEIRNPLTALKGFTQLLYQSSNAPNQRYYEIMLAELERINYIVGEFMLLSKPHQWQQLSSHDLRKVLDFIIPIIESQAIIHNVELQVEPGPELPQVRCDANQIKQVFVNLMKNSIEAMPQGGKITIRFELDFKDQVVVTIEDTGTGIPEEILKRLGEPFFSTKESGTGLGLMVCYKIIQSHGGALTIGNRQGNGTIVRINMPAETDLTE
ncbi:PAS domain S-box protein [Paenibacillus sp. sptzw28]|uniref:ATP-binding protein n=1 Tax=Paenibacillus sp. sptzw28 TaxID=715179 RepID=UPI001C6EA3BA|nr:ATP-binding protein [Paenibacillus sp. sptzw28]QYR21038.1 PAS domain S-box protein [Paenibacillus sp. sptzw28]